MKTLIPPGKFGGIPFPELRNSPENIRYPALVEPKFDGEFCYVRVSPDFTYTINKYGKVRMFFPALEIIKNLCNGESATFLAELYCDKGKAGDLYKLNSNKESDDLKIQCFDIIECNKDDLRDLPLIDRKEIMLELIGNETIECMLANNSNEAVEHYLKWIQMGYEGAVVKSAEDRLMLGPCNWAKMKRKDRNTFQVARIDKITERMEVAVPNVQTINSQLPSYPINYTDVGVKLLNKYRKYVNIHDWVIIEHQGVLASGSLRHPVLIPQPHWK